MPPSATPIHRPEPQAPAPEPSGNATWDRILLVQLGRLGDVVATRPSWHALAAAFPASRLEVLVPESMTDLFGPQEPVAGVHAYPSATSGGILQVARLVRALRTHRPDVVIDVTGSPRSRWVCWGSGARVRAGWGRRWLYHRGTPDVRRRDESYATEMGRLLMSIGIELKHEVPPLLAPTPSPALAQTLAAFSGAAPVLLHPGAANPIRAWRGNRFARLAEKLIEIGAPVLLLGGPGDRQLVHELSRESRVPLPVYFPESLGALMSVIAAGRLFVGLDSGPMHLACALGVPTIALFGPNVPRRAAPVSGPLTVVEVDLACRPCNQVIADCVHPEHNCMDRIEVEAVAARVAALLGS